MLREVRPVSEDEAPGGCTQEELATWLVKFTQTQSHH